MKTIKKAAAFFLMLFVLLFLASVLFPKTDKTSKVEVALANLRKEQTDTIQILVAGDSESYTSVSPLQIWQKTGFTSFVVGLPGQRLEETKEIIAGSFRIQKPKIVLMETNLLFRSKRSSNGMQEILASKWAKLFPIFETHNAWKNACRIGEEKYQTWKGFRMKTRAIPYERGGAGGDYMQRTTRIFKIPKDNLKSVEEIHELCRENGVELILYSSPSPKNYSYAKHNGIAQYALKAGIKYWDMNLELKDINWKQDTVDGGDHLNIAGASKVTEKICKKLKTLDLQDERENPQFDAWHTLAEQYKARAGRSISDIQKRAG